MNADQVRAVVSWLKAHPANAGNFDAGDVTSIMTYMSDPTMVNEYENPDNQTMNGHPCVEHGCGYVFAHGSCMNLRCGTVTVDGKDKCAFHDHPIFSDGLRNVVYQYHRLILEACQGL